MLGDVDRIASDQNRQLIPEDRRVLFDQLTNRELEGIAVDAQLSADFRTYARYQLAYRKAWGIYVDFDPDTGIERYHQLETEADFDKLNRQLRAEEAAIHQAAEAARARLLRVFKQAQGGDYSWQKQRVQ